MSNQQSHSLHPTLPCAKLRSRTLRLAARSLAGCLCLISDTCVLMDDKRSAITEWAAAMRDCPGVKFLLPRVRRAPHPTLNLLP